MGLETFLRWARPRNLLALVALAGAARFGGALASVPRRWYLAVRYPPAKGDPAQGSDIEGDLSRRARLKLQARYRRVCGLLAEAKAQGQTVDGLQAKADKALALNAAQYRDAALRVLAEVEAAIPRKRVRDIPSRPATSELRVPPDISPTAAVSGKKRPR